MLTASRISFPNLDTVQGATQITSSGSLNCKTLSPSEDNDNSDVFNGSFSCTNSTNSLSPGAKAGIAIAVIAAVAILAVLIWLYYRRRKRRRLDTATTVTDKPPPSTTPGTPPHNDNKPPSDVDADVDVEKDAPAPTIPRKPLSLPPPPPPPPPTSETRSDIPRSLIPGIRDDAPRAPPSETDVPMLDSENVHEAPAERDRERDAGPFELEAPVRGVHMRALEPQVAG